MFYEAKPDFFIFSQQKTRLEYPLHIHHYLELVHVIKGKIQMQIGQEIYTLSEGQLGVIFPNTIHNYHTLSDDENTYFRIMNCSPEMLPYFKSQLLHTRPKNPVLAKEQLHGDIFYAEKQLMNLEAKEENVPLISALISLLFARIFPCFDLILCNDRSTPPHRFFGGNHFVYCGALHGGLNPGKPCFPLWNRQVLSVQNFF